VFTSERLTLMLRLVVLLLCMLLFLSQRAHRAQPAREAAQNIVNHGWLSNPALVPESLIHFAIFHSDVKGRRNPEVYGFFLLSPIKQRERSMELCTE
jgi:hypothetical protein